METRQQQLHNSIIPIRKYLFCKIHLNKVDKVNKLNKIDKMLCHDLGFAKGREVRCPKKCGLIFGCRRYEE